MNGEDVFGSKIRVLYSSQMEFINDHPSPPPINNLPNNMNMSQHQLQTPQQQPQQQQQHQLQQQQQQQYQLQQQQFTTLKKEVANLLLEVPTHTLPFFKFREMFEKRYRSSVSSSDLYRMKDIVTISDNSSSASSASGSSLFANNGRTISLAEGWSKIGSDIVGVYCGLHPPGANGYDKEKGKVGWAERQVGAVLSNVVVEFGVLSGRICSLLELHFGGFPLFSFMDCYESEFGPLNKVEDGSGVPLEHLIGSVHGVEIVYGENGMKKVQWQEKKEYQQGTQQTLATQLSQLGREIVDLLKTFPRCSIPFSKLIPAYHHHFGRQCRVADYGHTSLSTLLQTLPLTVQIIGEGNSRVITLAHKAQMKRFATDVLRVLKASPGVRKQILVTEFEQAFTQVFPNRTFVPEDYGLCYFTDLITELVENSSLVTLVKDENGNSMLAIPKREQSAQEIHRTRVFANEVVELLAHSIRCELPFSKFIPSYHHHYGRQCRVSDFGFSKLAELFEAIGDIVEVVSPVPGTDCSPEDKIIRLSPKEQIKVVGEQIWNLVKKRQDLGIITYARELEDIFLIENGFALRVDLCEAEDIISLVEMHLSEYVFIDGDQVRAADRFQTDQLARDARNILEAQPEFVMDGDQFEAMFTQKYNKKIDVSDIEKELSHMIIVSEDEETKKKQIALAPLRVFAREITELLEESGGYVGIQNIEAKYLQKFGRPLRPQQLGYPSILTLLQAIPEVASLRGKNRMKRILVLNKSVRSYGERGYMNGYNNQNTQYYTNGTKFAGIKPSYAFNSGSNYQVAGAVSHEPLNNHWTASMPQMHPPLMVASPAYQSRSGDTNIFNFEQPTAALSTPVYDMWMTDGNGSPGSPPLSPPVIWAYHPICYPTTNSPGSPNLLMPSFSFGQWSPPNGAQQIMTNCYEPILQQK